MGRQPSYWRLRDHAAQAASWTAALRAKYNFTSHSRSSNTGPAPPRRFTKFVLPLTPLAITFQWPGGVSELGPSAQNSASTRAKSPRLTTLGAYGRPVIGLTGCPVPSLAPRLLFPKAPGEMSTTAPSSGVSWLLRRITSATSLRYCASPTPSSCGGGPGSIHGRVESSRANAKGRTAFHCDPTNFWMVAMGMPFWETALVIDNGCHRLTSTAVVPVPPVSNGG